MTDRDLNEAMARALGWDCLESTPCFHWAPDRMSATKHGNGWRSPAEISRNYTFGVQYPPHFCHDRNNLPEVWQAIEQHHMECAFDQHLRQLDPRNSRHTTETGYRWHAHTAPARLVVEAALRALGKYPTEPNDRAAEEMDAGQEGVER